MAPPTRRQSSKDGNGEGKKQQIKKLETTDSKERDQWMCIMNDKLVNGNGAEEKQASILKLRHPRTTLGTLYILSGNESALFQLHNFKEKYRSWLIGNRVCSDGSLYLTSPMDPLFLLLPYLAADEVKKYMTLDQLVLDEEFPDCDKLVSLCSLDQLSLICDYKDIDDDTKVFRYNKEKTLAWLRKKTDALADALEAESVQVSSKGSHSSIFVRSKSAATTRESFVEFAHGIVSDYLSPSLGEDLKSFLGIKENNEKDQDSLVENEPPSKKIKLTGDVNPTDDYSLGVDMKKTKKPTKLTAAQKQLSKVDKSGMKSISSFFSPKS